MAWIPLFGNEPIRGIAAALEYLVYGRKLTCTMHLDEYDGSSIVQNGLCSQEDLDFGTLDIYLY